MLRASDTPRQRGHQALLDKCEQASPVLRFPKHRLATILIFETGDGWLVWTPCGRWLCATRAGAVDYAIWLSHNLGGLPVREIA